MTEWPSCHGPTATAEDARHKGHFRVFGSTGSGHRVVRSGDGAVTVPSGCSRQLATPKLHTPMRVDRASTERGIRTALRNRCLRHHRGLPDTLILDELGLAHARGRIDLAVIGRHVHGYEIKSAVDTLVRLPRQLDVYRLSLHTLTFAVANRHLSEVAATVPDWCGIIDVTLGPRGGYHFHCIQRARLNPDLDPFVLAHLLWRREAQAALADLGASSRDLRASRKDLYRLLLESMSVPELTSLIRQSMIQRRTWRDRAQSLSCGD